MGKLEVVHLRENLIGSEGMRSFASAVADAEALASLRTLAGAARESFHSQRAVCTEFVGRQCHRKSYRHRYLNAGGIIGYRDPMLRMFREILSIRSDVTGWRNRTAAGCSEARGRQCAEQWAALRARFSQPHVALIFHLTNHYALIFALREWHEPLPDGADGAAAEAGAEAADKEQPVHRAHRAAAAAAGGEGGGDASRPEGTPRVSVGGVRVVREVLTARKGQRPSAWIDFEEARKTMLRWNGYKMLAVERTL